MPQFLERGKRDRLIQREEFDVEVEGQAKRMSVDDDATSRILLGNAHEKVEKLNRHMDKIELLAVESALVSSKNGNRADVSLSLVDLASKVLRSVNPMRFLRGERRRQIEDS